MAAKLADPDIKGGPRAKRVVEEDESNCLVFQGVADRGSLEFSCVVELCLDLGLGLIKGVEEVSRHDYLPGDGESDMESQANLPGSLTNPNGTEAATAGPLSTQTPPIDSPCRSLPIYSRLLTISWEPCMLTEWTSRQEQVPRIACDGVNEEESS